MAAFAFFLIRCFNSNVSDLRNQLAQTLATTWKSRT